MKIIEFLKEHEDWEEILSQKPYSLAFTRDKMFGKNLVIFKYNQIESDFHLELVRECRGLILEEDTWNPICVPFFKFGNYGEGYVPEIDWKTSKVTEKLDGSLIKISKLDGNLLVSTNGTIDAFKAPLPEQAGCTATSFGALALIGMEKVLGRKLHSFQDVEELFENGWTYLFELTSPYNKVVVSWPTTSLNYLGRRNLKTLQEEFFEDGPLSKIFPVPKVFPLGTLEECIKAAEVLPANTEGYVVVDGNFNRVKVKSPLYVSLHHMKSNSVFSYERCLEVVRSGEMEEVLTYFPEFKEPLEKIHSAYFGALEKEEATWQEFLKMGLETRKEQALFISKNFLFPGVAFSMLDKKVHTFKEGLDKIQGEKVLKLLHL